MNAFWINLELDSQIFDSLEFSKWSGLRNGGVQSFHIYGKVVERKKLAQG